MKNTERKQREEDVLRRMLNTPAKPHKPKDDMLSSEQIEELRRVKGEQVDKALKAFKKKTGQ